VEQLPENESPDAFHVLWTGESAVFQDQLLEEFERGRSEPLAFLVTFYSVIPAMPWASEGSRGSDLRSACAQKILEELLGKEPEQTALGVETVPLTANESAAIAELPKNWEPASASVDLWTGTDKDRLAFLESSLKGVGIPSLRHAGGDGFFRLKIRPEDETPPGKSFGRSKKTRCPKKTWCRAPTISG